MFLRNVTSVAPGVGVRLFSLGGTARLTAMTAARFATQGALALVLGAGLGGCGTSAYGGGSVDSQLAHSRPAGYPPPAAGDSASTWPSPKSDVAGALINCLPNACVDHPENGAPENTLYTEKIRGQVVLVQGERRDVLPFVIVNVLRAGKVVGTTKTDAGGKFSFAHLPRGGHQLALESTLHEASANVTIGYATTDVVLVAHPR
jgi:hypothetical protein